MTKYLSVRPDDYGNTMVDSAPLNGTASATDATRTVGSIYGSIERTADADWLYFWAGAGSATVTVSVTPGVRADVDLKLEVWALNGAAPLASFDPQGAILLAGSYPVTLPAEGYYFVALTAVGDGADPTVGYSNYASLGVYAVSVNWPTPATQPSGPPYAPPPPPVTPQVVVKVVSSSTSYKVNRKSTTATITATLAALDANLLPLKGVAVSIKGGWSSTSGAFKSTTFTVTTSTSTGQVTLTSPAGATPSTRLAITGVTLSGYAWNSALSTTSQDFSF